MNYFDIRYEYDAVSNRRLVESVYWDGVAGLRNKQVYWYAYDVMNRFTVTKGTLSGARATSKTDSSASVVAGTEGTTLGYDKLGQRRVADYTYNGTFIHETYGYSQDGYLQTITQGTTLKDVRVLDALGRTKEQHDKQNQTVTTSTYDADNRLLSQRYTDAKDGNKNNTTVYSYYTDTSNTGSSQAGTGALAKTVTTPDSGTATTTTYTYDYDYDYWDEAKQKSIVKSGVTTGSTTLSYNANGHLLSAFDAAAKLTTNYFNSANGLILKRERQQNVNAGTTQETVKVGSHFYYYAGGKRVGDVSDDPNDDPRLSYAEALARKAQDPQDKKTLYRDFKPVTSADFDQNYEPINDKYPGAVAGTYTVRGGESLQAVAQTLWGDGSMWYLIAEANGLIGMESLTEGQVLVIPNKVTNIHNNNSTVRPYSAGEAIGNIDPTLPAPPPPPKGGCGGIGMVLMIVVAVVVTVYTAGAAAGSMGATLTTAGGTVAASSVGAWTAGLGVLSGAGGVWCGGVGGGGHRGRSRQHRGPGRGHCQRTSRRIPMAASRPGRPRQRDHGRHRFGSPGRRHAERAQRHPGLAGGRPCGAQLRRQPGPARQLVLARDRGQRRGRRCGCCDRQRAQRQRHRQRDGLRGPAPGRRLRRWGRRSVGRAGRQGQLRQHLRFDTGKRGRGQHRQRHADARPRTLVSG